MPDSFLHQRKDFKALVETVTDAEHINDPALVEKDYWIMHAVYGLKALGLEFELKGGTSLSKGFGIIHRFSEDIDIQIQPFDDLIVDTNPNHEKPAHIESRRSFFQKLQEKILIPAIVAVERDAEYDDPKLRNAGLRLKYESYFDSVEGLKNGILLEAGFDQTTPNRPVTISSWVLDFAAQKKLPFLDNRAKDIPCYHPGYTFVEKLQTVAKKYRQFTETGEFGRNFLRHYYDIHQLLDWPEVQEFIGTPAYWEHKRKRFKLENQNLTECGAFTLPDPTTRARFEKEYIKTAALYYRGQVPFKDILYQIAKHRGRL